MTKKLFINNTNDCDKLYITIRDEERCTNYKLYMEKLWDTYYPYADKDFPHQLQYDFHARFWEMYLTCTLIFNHFKVVSKKSRAKGPDILISGPVQNIFIEAVTPASGANNNPDRVPDPIFNTGKAERLPDIEITLRYTSVISDKYTKLVTYLEQGIITSSDAYIIALNSCKLGILAKAESTGFPRILKAVLPIGNPEATINRFSEPTVHWHHQYRPNISRSSGSIVPTDIFLNNAYKGLSGIIYADSDVANRPNQEGDEFIFIHNPKAKRNAIAKGYFKFGMEYFVKLEEDSFSVDWNDWRK